MQRDSRTGSPSHSRGMRGDDDHRKLAVELCRAAEELGGLLVDLDRRACVGSYRAPHRLSDGMSSVRAYQRKCGIEQHTLNLAVSGCASGHRCASALRRPCLQRWCRPTCDSPPIEDPDPTISKCRTRRVRIWWVLQIRSDDRPRAVRRGSGTPDQSLANSIANIGSC
jgi:hypothetical protein